MIPACLMVLSSCNTNPTPDLHNEYANMEDCVKDNDPQEIQKQLCQQFDVDLAKKEKCELENKLEAISQKYACSTVVKNGETVVIGPAYPSDYYEQKTSNSTGGSGWIMGYWMGRSLSRGVYHPSSSSSFTHSGFQSHRASSSRSISRGGFGRSSRGFSIGG